jgi:allophanate hydrolase
MTARARHGEQDGGVRQDGTVLLAVVAAHRTGQPLHPRLQALGARFERCARTAPRYRLVALPGPGVQRGGIVADGGTAVEVELHRIPTAALGPLLCELPAPLAIGPVELVDERVLGMVCVGCPPDAVDISGYGSWPAYLRSVTV